MTTPENTRRVEIESTPEKPDFATYGQSLLAVAMRNVAMLHAVEADMRAQLRQRIRQSATRSSGSQDGALEATRADAITINPS